ncbi:hypothetical protein M8818_002802 [Zalaria obscura]|uniref:Uncharacterized protein n=1 Tax=Zalaria obscura TaxID=2024903 RepID=A0ACC3SHG7_9PEZI
MTVMLLPHRGPTVTASEFEALPPLIQRPGYHGRSGVVHVIAGQGPTGSLHERRTDPHQSTMRISPSECSSRGALDDRGATCQYSISPEHKPYYQTTL